MIIEKIRLAEARVQGKEHKKNGVVCQDFTFNYQYNGVNVISLSDGAGSRKMSQLGAELISRIVAKYVAQNFIELMILSEHKGKNDDLYKKDNEIIKKKITGVIDKEVEGLIKTNPSICVDDLSCTILFVASKGNQYFAGHIGDGVIGILKSTIDEDQLSVLSNPENGDAPNITFFATDKNAKEHLRIFSGECSNLKGFILMSDGPEEVLYNKKNGLSDNTKILFNALQNNTITEYTNFLSSILEKKIAEISYDDLSVAILYHDMIDTSKNIEEDLLKEFLDGLSDNQIIQTSSYCVLIDTSLSEEGGKLDYKARLEELSRRYD